MNEIVEQIHREFNTASDIMLSEAKKILAGGNPKKAARLVKAGFKTAKETSVLINIETAETIEKYLIKYPNNKFITEDQVKKVCKKYNLACAPIERYKGFVPEKNLREIESFSFHVEDATVDEVKIYRGWNTGAAIDFIFQFIGGWYIHKKVGLKRIPVNDPRLYWMSGKLFSVSPGTMYVSTYVVFDRHSTLICAPKKDMDVRGLKKIGAALSQKTNYNYPDPVVLKPVKGGYLIVTAWGDEASDELVVNEKMN